MAKSAAQTRRLQTRAAARGVEYVPPSPNLSSGDTDAAKDDEVPSSSLAAVAQKLRRSLAEIKADDTMSAKERRSARRKAEAVVAEVMNGEFSTEELLARYPVGKNPPTGDGEKISKADLTKVAAAKKLHRGLSAINSDKDMNAKDRRSSKRKAEAIASEESGGCAPTELLEWYEKNGHGVDDEKKSSGGDSSAAKKNPYVVFVGQLSYTTTSKGLFEHFRSALGSGDHEVTADSMTVRLLTEKKTNKSRGMAFVELQSPEVLYECLKLHLTHLDGRRINVERSSGGGSDSKKQKIAAYREQQLQHMSQTVENIISNHKNDGDLDADELDSGVVALCKRHSAAVIEQALQEYVEERGKEMDNPSAYLTHIIGRIAEEGLENLEAAKKRKKKDGTDNNWRGSAGRGGAGRGGAGRGGAGRGGGRGAGRGGTGRGGTGRGGGRAQSSGGSAESEKRGVGRIFLSMGRGRGRGRGYM